MRCPQLLPVLASGLALAAGSMPVESKSLRASEPGLMLAEPKLMPDGSFEFAISGAENLTYSIARSGDLRTWTVCYLGDSLLGNLKYAEQAVAQRQFFRASAGPAATVHATNYHGWQEALVISNGNVEAIVVPEIGRVMQLRFAGDDSGVFWENRGLDGQQPNPQSADWRNFGGDKVWPAPQADWPRVTGRSWPPPQAFDSMSVTASVQRGGVLLTSPVDPKYGIRSVRRIQADPILPVLQITTSFEKHHPGTIPTNRVSIWTVTQLKDPERMFVPVPQTSIYPRGYDLQSSSLPAGFLNTNNLISFTRNKATSHKIGSDAGTLLWVGPSASLRIDAPRMPGIPRSGYPDNGSSAEIYTNPDPDAYVELEMLGPLENLAVGQQISHTVTYSLFRRTQPTPEAEARHLLGL
jgi:hypothetical protein